MFSSIEQKLGEVVRGLPPEEQQAVLKFARFLAAQNTSPETTTPSDDLNLTGIREEWLQELHSIEACERGETDVIA